MLTIRLPRSYELCFNNKFSMYKSKKMMWEVGDLGDKDTLESEEGVVLAVNQKLEDYLIKTDMVSNEDKIGTL
jgi:hypothetical protein